MITVQRSLEVVPDVATVFDFLSDFTNTNIWDPGTVRTTRTSDGPLGVGATFHNVSKFRDRETTLEYELKRYEPGAHLTFTGVNSTVTATDDFTLSATASGGTAITYQAFFVFHRIFRLAEPFLRRGFEPIADETVAQLRDALNALDHS